MIDRIINVLLIPFKVRYLKQTPFILNWYFKSYYEVFINVGTFLNPVWFNMPSNGITLKFKNLYRLYKETKRYYEFMLDRPYTDYGNHNTVDLHEKLMNGG